MPTPILRSDIDAATYANPDSIVAELVAIADLTENDRREICATATDLVRRIRSASKPGLMESFLAEYGLSTEEGVALMCLAEALLRVPDADTIDALIEDKIVPSNWGLHLGQSSSSLVNASTWALMLTGRVLDDQHPGVGQTLRQAVKRLGEPVIRVAVGRAMKEMGRQFVLGENIASAMTRAEAMQAEGFTYSYDMLGEAARTAEDARHYARAYSDAITAIAKHATRGSVSANPGISIKLSALHPRYEEAQHDRVMAELVPVVIDLARQARAAGIGLNIDAEEADRLALSLDVIEAVLPDPKLANWDGFGIVVQAYGLRTGAVLDHLYALATELDRKIMVRLVKGAYWDAEVKRAQVEGLQGYPVHTRKEASDISYIANARRLLTMTDRIYPQFATHNAHSVSAVLHLARLLGVSADAYEFQRLHGMGEVLHRIVLQDHATRCRIYAPVGTHRDLLAYLVRRLLENGANSSFVNKVVDENVPPELVAACPFAATKSGSPLPMPQALFAPERDNSIGFDLTLRPEFARMEAGRAAYATHTWTAAATLSDAAPIEVRNPADTDDIVGYVTAATPQAIDHALRDTAPWDQPTAERAATLNRAADLFEAHRDEIFALLAREAGKTLPDAVGELREAVDFLRYYAAEARHLTQPARGVWTCISPWNFPLAIFTGQVAAALAAGNGVLAKPAPQTPLVAALAVRLLHQSGVPATALSLLPGGPDVGAALTADPRVAGVAFTGSTATAQKIRRAMANGCRPGTPLIAETGGLNAMIVDSTALPEHVVRDVILSAFRSAGQRCSALRCLYVQADIAPKLEKMLIGAMEELRLGTPWDHATDVGPLIDAAAQAHIRAYVDQAKAQGRLIAQCTAPKTGYFLPPTLLRIGGIGDLDQEIFGPVLHIATYKAKDLDRVIADINAKGFGLTFGLHTRIDSRVQQVTDAIKAGNIYVNRNQIGAVVGSQPFGGEGLSGTGPKAGGPFYLPRFAMAKPLETPLAPPMTPRDLPGPTGESNRLSLHPRGPVLCLGPDADKQVQAVTRLGGQALRGGTGDLAQPDIAAVLWSGDQDTARQIERTLAQRPGPIIPLVPGLPDAAYVYHERHICIDTTAAGGNAALLAEVSE